MHKKPKVSIVMSTYNNALFIRESIESVLAQTFSEWEFIIINDASSDDTLAIIREYEKYDKRIIVLANTDNKGLVANLITGVKKSKGIFIARIDGDDIWTDKNKLKKQVAYLEKNPAYGMVGTYASIIDQNGKILYQSKNPRTDAEIRNYLLIENCFFHSSVLMRKEKFDAAGGYDSGIKTAEDYNLWLKLGLVSKLHNLPEAMISYRINPEGINATKYRYQLQETIAIVKMFKNKYPNYMLGLVLWYMRGYVPKKTKTMVSEMMKSGLMIALLRWVKSTLLNARYSF